MACILKIYRICNLTVKFPKYEFNNKLLGAITLLIYIYIYIYIDWVQVTSDVIQSNVIPLNIFELDANFDKSTVRLHYLHIFSMLAKFQGDQILITMSSINCLNSNFCSLKLCIKDEFMDWMVNYI